MTAGVPGSPGGARARPWKSQKPWLREWWLGWVRWGVSTDWVGEASWEAAPFSCWRARWSSLARESSHGCPRRTCSPRTCSMTSTSAAAPPPAPGWSGWSGPRPLSWRWRGECVPREGAGGRPFHLFPRSSPLRPPLLDSDRDPGQGSRPLVRLQGGIYPAETGWGQGLGKSLNGSGSQGPHYQWGCEARRIWPLSPDSWDSGGTPSTRPTCWVHRGSPCIASGSPVSPRAPGKSCRMSFPRGLSGGPP